MKWEQSDSDTFDYIDGDGDVRGYIIRLGKGRFRASVKGQGTYRSFETRQEAKKYVEAEVRAQ